MLRPDDPHRPVPRDVLDAPGGFAWWYLEMLDETGSGLVLIWSFGLPFLPGYASAARKGAAQRPRTRPSLNVCVYEGGVPRFYALRELAPTSARWNGHSGREGTWQLGETRIERSGGSLRIALALPAAGGILRGTVEVEGKPSFGSPAERRASDAAPHFWAPLLGGAKGRAELRFGTRRWSLRGDAYHDRNYGYAPLDALGIDTWLWTHAALPHEERVAYLLWPESGPPALRGFRVSTDGAFEEVPGLSARVQGARRATYGMPEWGRIDLRQGNASWLEIDVERRVDDGPFYLRHVTRARAGDATTRGSAEVICPARVDLARHRLLVRMRVGSDLRRESPFLPLFEGDLASQVPQFLGGLRRAATSPLRALLPNRTTAVSPARPHGTGSPVTVRSLSPMLRLEGARALVERALPGRARAERSKRLLPQSIRSSS